MDLVSDIFSNEINTSGFVQLEDQTYCQISDCLKNHKYRQLDQKGHIWTRGDRRVFVRLVDSIDATAPMDHLNRQDIVITDNFIGRAVAANVIALPDSWYGIYSHPVTLLDLPITHDYSFLVNRIDETRLLVMLELSKKIHLHRGLINFNCVKPENWINDSLEIRRNNLLSTWDNLGDDHKKKYRGEWIRLEKKMPYHNHALSHDQSMQSVKINIVMETYSPTDVISFSEKTFRALVLPVPWTLFAGRYAIQRLRRLGFDTLDDLVDHDRYDGLQNWQEKHCRFISASVDVADSQSQDKNRLFAAALHNQQLLKKWRGSAEQDLQNWLTDLESVIK